MSHRAGPPLPRGWREWVRRHAHRGGTTESKDEKQGHTMVSQRVLHALVGLIAGVWTIQFFAVWLTDFKPDTTVNAAFMLVAGAVFTREALRRDKGGSGET